MAAADTTSIASGIADAGRSIGQGLAMRAADMKRREEQDKRKAEQAKKIRGMAKMFQEDLGLSDSEVQGRDADELGGLIEGFMLSQSAKHQKLQQERDALTIAAMKALERDRQREESFNKEFDGRVPSTGMQYKPVPFDREQGVFASPNIVRPGDRFDSEAAVSNLPYDPAGISDEGARLASEFANAQEGGMSTTLGQTNGLPSEMTLSNVLRAAARHGKLLDPRLDNLTRALQQGNKGGPLTFQEDAVTGARFAQSGNMVLPSGTNPEKFTTVTVTDPNTGLPVELPVNPRTGQALLKPRAPQANRVPPEFTTKLAEMAGGLADPKYKEQVSTSIRAAIDTAHTLKQIDKEQRDALYEQYGLTAGKGKDTSAPAKAGVNADQELKQARNAIAQGRSKAAVAARYKERTGQDFPDE